MCVLCVCAGCLRAFCGRKVVNRPEGEFRMLTNMPALLVGKPEGRHAGLSKRLEPPLWGQGIRLGSSPTNLSGLPQTTRPFFHGAWLWAPSFGQRLLFPAPWAYLLVPTPLGEAEGGVGGTGFTVSHPGLESLLCTRWIFEFSQNLLNRLTALPLEALVNSWVRKGYVKSSVNYVWVFPSYSSVGSLISAV